MSVEQPPLEMWGGIECSVVRVRDVVRDQSIDTGHRDRPDDLDAMAALGIERVRYPVVWETVAPERPEARDFSWHDERLARLHELGVKLIAGLVHHGSGPRYTSLIDSAFPELLADYAGAVAERYPWIDAYTPVNEPLTTARFSGLYGVWYPHGRSYDVFLRALVQQCRGVVLAMRAIRRVNPAARLVQTEDLGKTFGTGVMRTRAVYENQRRWLTFDLLFGRVDPRHPWWPILLKHGITEEELRFFHEGDGAPDLLGINYYLTSERFLESRVDQAPAWAQIVQEEGHPHVNLPAVHMPVPVRQVGPALRLAEAWQRYGRPVAVTEVHNGCTREEQVRWLMDVWNGAKAARAGGARIEAVTVWSMFGAMDWNSLLTKRQGYYEPGPFDVRGGQPRRTLVGTAAASLATTGGFDHPVLDGPGWWLRDQRYFPHVRRKSRKATGEGGRKLLITGATGTLGRAFARICEVRGLAHVLVGRGELDIADPASIEAALERHRPWAVVNTAGYVRVADAEREPDRCMRENARGAELTARACAALGLPFVTFSSDLVFDGRLGRPYVEDDERRPMGVYGSSKAEAERRVLAAHPDALVVRTSAFFGPWDRHNFLWRALSALSAGRSFEASATSIVSPTYVPDLVQASLDLMLDGETGLWHLANGGVASWHDLARQTAEQAGQDFRLLVANEDGPLLNNALSSERGIVMPPLGGAIERYLRECEIAWAA